MGRIETILFPFIMKLPNVRKKTKRHVIFLENFFMPCEVKLYISSLFIDMFIMRFDLFYKWEYSSYRIQGNVLIDVIIAQFRISS